MVAGEQAGQQRARQALRRVFDLRPVQLAAHMHYLAMWQQRRQRGCHGPVDAARAPASAEHEQHRQVRMEAQGLPRCGFLRSQQLGPDRIACHHGLARKVTGDLRKRHGDLARKPAGQCDGAARRQVGQVDEQRHATGCGGPGHRRRDIAAGHEDHVRPEFTDDTAALLRASHHARQVGRGRPHGPAAHLARRNRTERQARAAGERLLDAAGFADIAELVAACRVSAARCGCGRCWLRCGAWRWFCRVL